MNRRALKWRVPLSWPKFGSCLQRDQLLRLDQIGGSGSVQKVEQFFEEFLKKPAIGVSSCTAGLHLALRAAGVEKGDRVYCSSLSFIASAHPILYHEAVPVFIDSEIGSWNLDPLLVGKKLRSDAERGKLPKALVAVHTFGQSLQLDPLVGLCQTYGVKLIEDVANALGGNYQGRPHGTVGDFAVFSFNRNKVITGGGGGVLVGNDSELVAMAAKWANQGREAGNGYLHREVGYNYRMSEISAAYVSAQLPELDRRVEGRRRVFERYVSGFADQACIVPMPEMAGTYHTRWLSAFRFEGTEEVGRVGKVLDALAARGIEAREVWRPLHKQPVFGEVEKEGHQCSETLHRQGIVLPSSEWLDEKDQALIVETLLETWRS